VQRKKSHCKTQKKETMMEQIRQMKITLHHHDPVPTSEIQVNTPKITQRQKMQHTHTDAYNRQLTIGSRCWYKNTSSSSSSSSSPPVCKSKVQLFYSAPESWPENWPT